MIFLVQLILGAGKGYWILDSYGEVYSFGDAEYFGGLTPEGQQVGTPQA